MKTEILTWHCNNILKMRAICTLPSRIIEREPVFNQKTKKLYSSNEILLFPLGPASAENLFVPWAVALVNLTGRPFFSYCTNFQYFPKFSLNSKSTFTCQVCHSHASRHRVSGVDVNADHEQSEWHWCPKQTLSCTTRPPHVLGEPQWATPRHIFHSDTCVKLKKIHRSNLQQQLLEDSRIHWMSLQIMYLVMKSGHC